MTDIAAHLEEIEQAVWSLFWLVAIAAVLK